ncbi:MAG TPA: hypothetical protein VHX14_02880 [Thermoanaerobaculia bacterium]|nr:hypothetical protein [Thermoanaerobaculia bacterium]
MEIAANAFDVLVSQIRDYGGSVWTSIVDHPVPLTRHDSESHDYEGCSQKTLAPLATLSLPLSRHVPQEQSGTVCGAQPDDPSHLCGSESS